MSIIKKFVPKKGICRVKFRLPDSIVDHPKSVAIVGDFNLWQPGKNMMHKDKNEIFTAKIDLPIGEVYEFRYLIDKYIWENEWEADGLVKTPYEEVYNSVINCKEDKVD